MLSVILKKTGQLMLFGVFIPFYMMPVQAAINLSGTRFIYNQDDSEITVQVHNEGDYPVLLQSWIDDGRANVVPEKMQVPFVLTPPLTRLEAKRGQTLRITSTGNSFPADHESVYWLNVLEIPPVNKKEKNQLMVAFRNRVKLFWRPAALKKGAMDAPASVTWAVKGQGFEINNPTPYYVSLTGVHVVQNGHSVVMPAKMIGPSEKAIFEPDNNKGIRNMRGDEQVDIIYINDYGAEKVQKITH